MLTRIQCYECSSSHTIDVEDVFSPRLDSWICDYCANELKLLDEGAAVELDLDEPE